MSGRPAALGALAGAALTVTVYEGKARIFDQHGAPAVAVAAGESRTVGPAPTPTPSPTPNSTRAAGPRGAASPAPGPTATAAEVRDAVARLQADNERLRVRAAFAEGQLQAREGAPVPWPEDLPPVFAPAGFEAHLRARLADFPDAELVEVDCAEYPCVAAIRSHDESEDWAGKLGALGEGEDPWGTGAPAGVMAMAAEQDDDADDLPPVRLYVVSAWPGDREGADPHQRVQTRARDLLQGLGEELMAEEATP